MSPCSCFYFSMLMRDALAFNFSVTVSFSLPVFSFFPFWARAVAFSMASTLWWSCGALPGLAALCLVLRSRGALLRRLGPRRCECELDSVPSRVFHLNSYVNCLSARGIEERFVSQSSTLLLVWRTGWLHHQRWQNHLPAPLARTAPLRSSPSSPSRNFFARVS